jgi:hypothetical protein
MDKQQFIEKATEALKPFETENLIKTMQTLTLKEIFTNPVVLLVITLLLFFGVIKRSKTVLLTMFSLIGLIVIMRFAMPATTSSEEISLGSVVPFIAIGVFIGGVVIYFSLVKSD